MADPYLERTFREDPLFAYIKRQWSNIIFAIFLVCLAIYGYGKFKDNTRRAYSEAADRLHRIVNIYSQLESSREEIKGLETFKVPEGKTTEEADKLKKENQDKLATKQKELETSTIQFREGLKVLADFPAPYPQLANLYSGLLARSEGRINDMRTVLSSMGWEDKSQKLELRLVGELAALALARKNLEDADQVVSAKSKLATLAEKGEFVAVPAALTLARIAVTAEETAKAKGLLEAASVRAPKQSELVSPIIKELANAQ